MRRDAAYLADMIAAAGSFTVLGEAASRLPADVRDRHVSVAWAQAKGMRNVIVHEYFGITWEEVWDVATNLVPLLRAQVVDVFKAEFPDDTLEL